MPLYELPKFEIPRLKAPKFWRDKVFLVSVLTILISTLCGFLAGAFSGSYFSEKNIGGWVGRSLSKLNINLSEPQTIEKTPVYLPQTSQEEATIQVVKEVSPAVVSIIITKDVPVFEQYYINPFEEFGQPFFQFEIPQYRQKGTQKQEVGGGTGFIISTDGMILTNSHVVSDEEADYTVFTLDGKKYPAKVLARDTFRDLALIKIEPETTVDGEGKIASKSFPAAKLGDSDNLQIGQTVITIGNALGEFKNTVSAGVISGLGRRVTASGGGVVEALEDVIQTDAAINLGNSGGPLLNLKGEVIGVNFAMVQQAENIGFAIPINQAKKDIEQVKTLGKIVYPYLGVYYCLIDEEVQKEYNLSVDYGAWVGRDRYCRPYEKAVIEGTAAAKAGLKEGDIILEFNGEKITQENTLAKIIMKHNPGDEVTLKILREGEEKIIPVTLGEGNE